MISVSTHSWAPLLEGSRAEAAWEAVFSVARALAAVEDWSEHGPGISRGCAGAALFFGYLAKATHDPEYLDLCNQLRAEMGRMLLSAPSHSSLFIGFTGVGWVETHLANLLEPQAPDGAGELDDAVLMLLDRPSWHAGYDLVSGLAGLGVYGLERLERGKGRLLLGRVIAHLERMAESQEGGLTWFTPPELLPAWQREDTPLGCWNLGVAHGVPGVIALLGRCLKAGVEPESSRRMLDGAVAWLRALRNSEGSSAYGCRIAKGRPRADQNSRIAWCYGDLGLSVAYCQAGLDRGRKDWTDDALQMARAAAQRPTRQTGVVDAGLCHGSAGNALLFLRLYAATGEEGFRVAADHYLDRTLEWRNPSHPFGGFPIQHRPQGQAPEFQYAPGLLEGSCGVALTFLAALTDLAPDWDRHLLSSLEPGSLA